MEAQAANTDLRAPPCPFFTFNDEVDLGDIIAKGSFSFDDWTALISAVEDKFPNDIRKISLVYDSFLSKFPLCHGYRKRYAYRKMRLCGCDEAIEVFEDAVMSAATYCVGLWVDNCQFAVSSLEDPQYHLLVEEGRKSGLVSNSWFLHSGDSMSLLWRCRCCCPSY